MINRSSSSLTPLLFLELYQIPSQYLQNKNTAFSSYPFIRIAFLLFALFLFFCVVFFLHSLNIELGYSIGAKPLLLVFH